MPLPSLVFELPVVGFWEVLQQTPRAITAEPPSFEISPPLVAVVDSMAEAEVVESIGIEHVNVVWLKVNGVEIPQALYAQTYLV